MELNLLPAWLNNCVGHFNHRYFFSFCMYMTLGCIYCSVRSKDLFLDAYSAIEVRTDTLVFTLLVPQNMLDSLNSLVEMLCRATCQMRLCRRKLILVANDKRNRRSEKDLYCYHIHLIQDLMLKMAAHKLHNRCIIVSFNGTVLP